MDDRSFTGLLCPLALTLNAKPIVDGNSIVRYRRHGHEGPGGAFSTDICKEEAYACEYCVVCGRSTVSSSERYRETRVLSPLYEPLCHTPTCLVIRDQSLVLLDAEQRLPWLLPWHMDYTWHLELIRDVKVDFESRSVEAAVEALAASTRRLALAKAMLPTVPVVNMQSGCMGCSVAQMIPFDLFYSISVRL